MGFLLRVSAADVSPTTTALGDFVVNGSASPVTSPGDPSVCYPGPPSLILHKVVIDDDGGTASGSEWDLRATDTGTIPLDGPDPAPNDAGLGLASGVTFAADAYTLSETGGIPGYAASAWDCSGEGALVGDMLTRGLGESAVCTITNDDIALVPAAPRLIEEEVRAALIPFQGESKRIRRAIRCLDRALEPDRWIDDTHLVCESGETVFKKERSAVKKLAKALERDSLTAAAVTNAISRLVGADRALAQTLLDEAMAALVLDPDRQDGVDEARDEAEEELADGDADDAAGKPHRAIDHYQEAWEERRRRWLRPRRLPWRTMTTTTDSRGAVAASDPRVAGLVIRCSSKRSETYPSRLTPQPRRASMGWAAERFMDSDRRPGRWPRRWMSSRQPSSFPGRRGKPFEGVLHVPAM